MAGMVAYANAALVSNVVITASSSATGHDMTNLSHPGRWKDWRSSTSTAAPTVEFNLATAVAMLAFGVVDATIISGGALIVETKVLVGDPYVAVGTFTFPSFNPTGVSMLWTARTAQYVRYRFTNPTAVSAFAQMGVAFLATGTVTLSKIAPGPSYTRVDPSVQRRAIGGARTSVVLPKYHTYDGELRLLTAPERDTYAQMFDDVGTTDAVIFSIDTDTPQHVAYGVLEGFEATHREGTANRWGIPFTFTEDVA